MESATDDSKFWIETLTIGGTELSLPHPGTVAVVGGNNVGKTTLLRQIHAEALNPRSGNTLVLDRLSTGQNSEDGFVQPYVCVARIDDRIRHVDAVPPPPDVSSPDPPHPIYELVRYPEALTELQLAARSLFGMTVTLDKVSGHWGFRVGMPEATAPRVDEATGDYGAQLARLPKLQEQGDGVRSALGTLMTIIGSRPMVLLLDEPEAFLHPPQARELGRQLARLAKQMPLQLILATHDKNLLSGLLDAETAPVAVLHLRRDGDQTSAQLLDTPRVQELRDDPLLRYGDALDGLFHDAVVLVEGLQDGAFYSAALDARVQAAGGARTATVHFLTTNGRDGMAKTCRKLRALGMTVISSPDMDVLSNNGKLKDLVEAHGGNWADVCTDYLEATRPFHVPKSMPSREALRTAVDTVLGSSDSVMLTPEEMRELKRAVAPEGPWAPLKRDGIHAFGETRPAAERLMGALGDMGIVPVQVGELECFLTTRSVAKGAKWLGAALEANAHTTSEAQDHVHRLLMAAGLQ